MVRRAPRQVVGDVDLGHPALGRPGVGAVGVPALGEAPVGRGELGRRGSGIDLEDHEGIHRAILAAGSRGDLACLNRSVTPRGTDWSLAALVALLVLSGS